MAFSTGVLQLRSSDHVVQCQYCSRKRCVDDVGDGRQEDVKIVMQKCGGDGIKFTKFRRCTLNYFQDKVISDRVKGL